MYSTRILWFKTIVGLGMVVFGYFTGRPDVFLVLVMAAMLIWVFGFTISAMTKSVSNAPELAQATDEAKRRASQTQIAFVTVIFLPLAGMMTLMVAMVLTGRTELGTSVLVLLPLGLLVIFLASVSLLRSYKKQPSLNADGTPVTREQRAAVVKKLIGPMREPNQ